MTVLPDVLGPIAETDGLPVLKNKGYDGNVAFVSDGHIQTHLAQKDVNISFRTGHTINPLERGHIAYRTDDLVAFKAHPWKMVFPFQTGVKQQSWTGNRFFLRSRW